MAVHLQEGDKQQVANHLPEEWSEFDQVFCSPASYIKDRAEVVSGGQQLVFIRIEGAAGHMVGSNTGSCESHGNRGLTPN